MVRDTTMSRSYRSCLRMARNAATGTAATATGNSASDAISAGLQPPEEPVITTSVSAISAAV